MTLPAVSVVRSKRERERRLPLSQVCNFGTLIRCLSFFASNENLVRDTYLRRNMDEQGWVSVSLIAGFNKEHLSISTLQNRNLLFLGSYDLCEFLQC
ncbi:hypothetical protein L1987_40342 [Smallanthus sonchifolius]|uniref:Uncharacterized protein n=1 Tax=Smallanthus sonchifolius TaxID=185202 RepID=A0ACB9GT48_9ASTR|nr:hypothetical protein L1987_40342 [Smallanthus sonchifolius]